MGRQPCAKISYKILFPLGALLTIAYLFSLLAGEALIWATAVWLKGSKQLTLYDRLIEPFQVFYYAFAVQQIFGNAPEGKDRAQKRCVCLGCKM